MNSLEAARMVSVLDDSIEHLRTLSFVTPQVLLQAQQMVGLITEELARALHEHYLVTEAHAKTGVSNDALTASTLKLCRLLRSSPSAQRLQTLHTERAPGMLQVLSYFEKLRTFAQKRLTTTVEEDHSNAEYYDEVRDREERAVADRLQLEQKLRLQRVELTKQQALNQASEDKARAELHSVRTTTASAMESLTSEAANVRSADVSNFDHAHMLLSKELGDAEGELAGMKAEHNDAEGLLRKARKRVNQDVEAMISEYDADVGSKEDEYRKCEAEHDALIARLEELSREHHSMLQDRHEHEERLKQAAATRLAESLRMVRRNRAARVIQAQYRLFRAAKEKARKKAKKEVSKKKGGKK